MLAGTRLQTVSSSNRKRESGRAHYTHIIRHRIERGTSVRCLIYGIALIAWGDINFSVYFLHRESRDMRHDVIYGRGREGPRRCTRKRIVSFLFARHFLSKAKPEFDIRICIAQS
ncbi:hypothetical protein PUN28_003104 [Cardiocondyla obscurior]|uniref:Uncharacterized protein n=1 Tax=Cardiocondyla obscurior TaxID=286306 RepID=A0AAW2GJ18_9HYME